MMFSLGALGALRPGIVLREALGVEEAGAQRLATSGIVGDPRLHILDPDALDPRRGAFEIEGFLAVELDEGGAIIHRLRLGRALAAKVGGADGDAAVAADMEPVPAVDPADSAATGPV